MGSRTLKILNLLKTETVSNVDNNASFDVSSEVTDIASNTFSREIAPDASSNTELSIPLSPKNNIVVLDPNDENGHSNCADQIIQSTCSKSPIKQQLLNTPTANVDDIISHLPSTSKDSNKCRYIIENPSSTKIRLRKLNSTYTDYCDSEEEPFSAGSSDDYKPDDNNDSSSSSETSESTENIPNNHDDNQNEEPLNTPIKKGKKRVRNRNNWKQVKAKRLRNLGQEYTSRTGKIIKARNMKPACTNKCILSCSKKFSHECRSLFFKEYWNLGSLQRQRDFLSSCVDQLILKYRRVSSAHPRKPNCAFHLLDNGKKIRVCKTFLINTLGISEKMMRTVINLKVSEQGIIAEDRRGKHDNHRKIDEALSNSVFDHINSIPRIESHYVRKETNRDFIDGGLTIAEMHRDYCERMSASNQPSATYDYYARIFNTKFNIGFFSPKKDQCDLCASYKNASENEKIEIENKYNEHLDEKKLSREEKDEDKRKAQAGSISLAIYDLQAVLPVPVGQSSAFFYKSRLNCYNFTITEITKGLTKAFFWHEVFGNRGAIEIGSCVLIYLEELSKSEPGLDIVFFSDNCMGQQKNRFLIAAYLYAVEHFEIGSITHKFLIRGHTQNEADAVHSIIEKKISLAKKSGPIYVPDQYVSIIREAKKKGKKIVVKEMGFENFFDVKALANDMNLTINKNTVGNDFKINEVKMLRFTKGSEEFHYKTSYKQKEWLQVNFRQRKRSKKEQKDLNLKNAYDRPFQLSENKKKDLLSLVKSNLIPAFYRNYYEGILQ